jgi:hypothetical protein
MRTLVLILAGLLVGLRLFTLSMPAHAEVVAVAPSHNGDIPATTLLTDEPCKLDAVTNLKYRAIWQEQGKPALEGCYGRSGFVIVIYFSDKTVVPALIQQFHRPDSI